MGWGCGGEEGAKERSNGGDPVEKRIVVMLMVCGIVDLGSHC